MWAFRVEVDPPAFCQYEGWQAISTHFDDGGYSGGNMERPALKQLMAEIHAGKVNVIVVYKVDRLTRSLSDFAKLIEQFEKFGVSFVSVTQQFNTTTSMGRLTLNVLLSFAQFEREVTGERIRDKILASKKKGMWMGGTVPLGYSSNGDHKLLLNETEATTVRTIFREFLRLGSVHNLQDWLRENNIKSRNGNHFFRGPLYTILRNPHYLGLIKHKKDTYPGEHTPIIDRETWDKVQALLVENRQGGKRKPRATKVSLFTGILFDKDGILYTPTHASKNGRRYRYYTSQSAIKKIEKIEIPTRIPAPDIEKAVTDRILALLKDPDSLLAAISDSTMMQPTSLPNGLLTKLFAQSMAFADNWEKRLAPERACFLRAITERVLILSTHVEIRVRVVSLIEQLLGKSLLVDQSTQRAVSILNQIALVECSYRHIPQGRALRLIVGATARPASDKSHQAILKALARARGWYEQIITGQVSSLRQIASNENFNSRYVNQIFPLALLNPTHVEALISSSAPEQTLEDLLDGVVTHWI